MIDPDLVSVRRGHDPRYLNVDYDGVEIGYLHFTTDWRLAKAWAQHPLHQPTIAMIVCLVVGNHIRVRL